MTFNEVFTFDNLFESYKNSCKGVRWKTSTKNYEARSVQNVAAAHTALHGGKYTQKPFAKFKVCERGKTREIRSLHISDRVVQKCYCDNFLVPLFSRRLIYDNGACMKDKGLRFTAERLKAHLQRYYRENKTNVGYVLTFDFSKYFDSIDHEILIAKARKVIEDDRLFELFAYFVNSFEGDKGLGLGSQISQVSALFYTNDLDHFIKERLRMRYYGRYMDDGYIISNSKEKLQECVKEIMRIAQLLKLNLNLKKTRICRIEKGFMFLNRHWTLTEKGYVKLKPSHTTLLRLRKRFRKIRDCFGAEALERFIGSVNGFIKFFNNRRLESYVYN